MSSYPVGPFDLLVIGGSGFIGAKTVQARAKAGYRLAYTYNTHLLPLPVEAYHVDLVESDALEACIRAAQPRVILYCAVPRGDEPVHRAVSVVGVQRTLASLEKAVPSALFVYVSTNSVFSGRNDTNRLISPTLVDNFAEAVLEILSERFLYRGIIHIAGSQPLSDYDYALCLARHLQCDEALVRMDQVETSSASGVMNISLDGSFTQSLLTTRLLNVREQLTRLFPDTG